jgi:hypothetical protein
MATLRETVFTNPFHFQQVDSFLRHPDGAITLALQRIDKATPDDKANDDAQQHFEFVCDDSHGLVHSLVGATLVVVQAAIVSMCVNVQRYKNTLTWATSSDNVMGQVLRPSSSCMPSLISSSTTTSGSRSGIGT